MNKTYPLPGTILFQRYAIKDVLTCGGTALILICRDLKKNKIVTVKRFFPEKMLPELAKRVRTEPFLPIKSQFVAKTEETFFTDGCFHSVQPLIEGKTLSDILISVDSLSEKDAAQIGLCLGKALEAVHSAGILSTDVKPDNIIITPQRNAVLIDLSAFEQPFQAPQVSMGTPPYSAPELENKNVLYPSTDIFSAGVVLFHSLIGNDSFEKLIENNMSMDKAIFSSELQESCPGIWKVIAKATSPYHAMRQKTAREFIAEISLSQSLTAYDNSVLFIRINGQKLKIPEGLTVIGRAVLCPRDNLIDTAQFALKKAPLSLNVLALGQRVKTMLNGKALHLNVWTKLKTGDVLSTAGSKATVCKN